MFTQTVSTHNKMFLSKREKRDLRKKQHSDAASTEASQGSDAEVDLDTEQFSDEVDPDKLQGDTKQGSDTGSEKSFDPDVLLFADTGSEKSFDPDKMSLSDTGSEKSFDTCSEQGSDGDSTTSFNAGEVYDRLWDNLDEESTQSFDPSQGSHADEIDFTEDDARISEWLSQAQSVSGESWTGMLLCILVVGLLVGLAMCMVMWHMQRIAALDARLAELHMQNTAIKQELASPGLAVLLRNPIIRATGVTGVAGICAYFAYMY